ncbi:unnamed protein product [Orchesella dallaii]|uniref:C2H2-type domain-containing protein n=1 Tax=Orchesella dallaii TaxID=48710 RepID=A0ABP1Q1P8_9HEXA
MNRRRGEPARANNSFSNPNNTRNHISFASTSNGQGSSRITYASSISACWNNSSIIATSTPSTTPVISSASASQPQQRITTCLFCPNTVILPTQRGERNGRLEKFIGNLCKHLKIQRSQLPGQCTKEMYPFCANKCEKLVMKLWRQEGALRDILQDIDATVDDIEHAVVDGEILGNRGRDPSSITRVEKLKVTKLKDMIISAYRDKLRRRMRAEGSLIEENYAPENENQDDGDITENLSSGVISNYNAIGNTNIAENIQIETPETELATVKREHIGQLGDVTISVADPISIRHSVEVGNNYGQDGSHHVNLPLSLHQQDENETICSYEEQDFQHLYAAAAAEEDQHWSVDPSVVARTMVVANVNDETGVNPMMKIKQEAFATATNDYEHEEGEVLALQKRKRRFLYEGVEIYTVSGTGRYASMNYLQCSECDYTVPLPNHKRGLASRYTIVKTHILHVHKNKTGLPKGTRQREHICAICNKTFLTREEMRMHKATHSADEMQKCDICGKPVGGNGGYNLLIHKFSHKNDEERRIAVANGERGASMALLSGRKNNGKPPPSISTPKSVRRQPTTSATRPIAQPKRNKARRTELYNPNVNEFSCEFCDRTFSRKCHLARHNISMHLKNQTPSSSSSSSKSKNYRRQVNSPPVRQAPPPSVLKAILTKGRQPTGNLGQRGVLPNNLGVRVAVPPLSINPEGLTDIGRRLVIAGGRVVTVTHDTLSKLLSR